MSNYMENVAQILGVELGEEFQVKERNTLYRLLETGCEWYDDNTGKWRADTCILNFLLLGEMEIVGKPWQPKAGEEYFISSPSDKDGWDVFVWMDNVADRFWYDNGLVFRTEEEASEMTGKIIAFVKKERGINED